MIRPTKMTRTERLHGSLFIDAMQMIEEDLHHALMDRRTVPREWHEIASDRDPRHPKQVRVTLRLDADVVRAFKALGPGYQPRMNRVLRAWMTGRAARIIRGLDTTDFILQPERVEADMTRRRTKWGDTEAEFDKISAESARRKEDGQEPG